jgi:hypothetical protein
MFRLRRIPRSTRKPRPTFDLLEDRAVPATYVWTGSAGDSNWVTPGNWKVGGSTATSYPQLAGDIAQFTGKYTAAQSVTLSSALAVGEIDFGGTSYSGNFNTTLVVNSNLTLSNGNGTAAVIHDLASANTSAKAVVIKGTGILVATSAGVLVTEDSAELSLQISNAITTLAPNTLTATVTCPNVERPYTQGP